VKVITLITRLRVLTFFFFNNFLSDDEITAGRCGNMKSNIRTASSMPDLQFHTHGQPHVHRRKVQELSVFYDTYPLIIINGFN
jgi:hypothetical protein